MKMIIWCVSLLVFNIKSYYRLYLYSPLNSHPKIRLVMSLSRTTPSGKLSIQRCFENARLYVNARTILSLFFQFNKVNEDKFKQNTKKTDLQLSFHDFSPC